MNNKHNATDGIGMTSMRARKRLIEQLKLDKSVSAEVLDVMLTVPRHEFLEEGISSHAYQNTALPIGFGQTISQPSTVALMTTKLIEKFPNGLKKVLEIGTGCGYQSAVISMFAEQVFSIERVKQLHYAARDRLYDLKYRNVKCIHADGFLGCEDGAPYDGILAAAVSEDVPEELIDQLIEGGRLIMPVRENASGEQSLIVIDKTVTGVKQVKTSKVAFVPRVHGVG